MSAEQGKDQDTHVLHTEVENEESHEDELHEEGEEDDPLEKLADELYTQYSRSSMGVTRGLLQLRNLLDEVCMSELNPNDKEYDRGAYISCVRLLARLDLLVKQMGAAEHACVLADRARGLR